MKFQILKFDMTGHLFCMTKLMIIYALLLLYHPPQNFIKKETVHFPMQRLPSSFSPHAMNQTGMSHQAALTPTSKLQSLETTINTRGPDKKCNKNISYTARSFRCSSEAGAGPQSSSIENHCSAYEKYQIWNGKTLPRAPYPS